MNNLKKITLKEFSEIIHEIDKMHNCTHKASLCNRGINISVSIENRKSLCIFHFDELENSRVDWRILVRSRYTKSVPR
jgi:hypothetical protein